MLALKNANAVFNKRKQDAVVMIVSAAKQAKTANAASKISVNVAQVIALALIVNVALKINTAQRSQRLKVVHAASMAANASAANE